MRLFVAIPVKDSIANQLIVTAQSLYGVKVRWVRQENLHFTVCFIGNTENNAAEYIQKIDPVLHHFKPFDLVIKEIKIKQNRTHGLIWFEADPSVAFSNLVKNIHRCLGLTLDHKPLPHITVARFKKHLSVPKVEPVAELTIKANEVCLFNSELNPDGPVYTELFKWDLVSY